MRCPHCGSEISSNQKFCMNCGAAVPPPSVAAENTATKQGGSKTILIVLGIILLAAIIAAIAFFVTGKVMDNKSESSPQATEEQTTTDNQDSEPTTEVGDLTVICHDINYSQIGDPEDHLKYDNPLSFSNDPVDCLIKIKNNGDKPVTGIEFEVTVNGKPMANRKGGNIFNAIGLIDPGKEGYMYSKMPVSEKVGRAHKQGDVKITKIIGAGAAVENYNVNIEGYIGTLDPVRDLYPLDITNTNSVRISEGSTIVVVTDTATDSLEAKWGAGRVKSEVAPQGSSQQFALYNPGFKDFDKNFIDNPYKVMVFDRSVLIK